MAANLPLLLTHVEPHVEVAVYAPDDRGKVEVQFTMTPFILGEPAPPETCSAWIPVDKLADAMKALP